MMGLNDKFQKLHDEGNVLENRKFKLFVISDIFGKFHYNTTSKTLEFETDAFFEVGCIDEDILIHIIEYLNLNMYIHIGKTILEHNGYEILNENIQNKDIVMLQTISPVTVYETENKHITYLDPNSDAFMNSIVNNIKKKYFLIYAEECPELSIVIRQVKRKKVIQFKSSFFIAYDLLLDVIKPTKQVLQVLTSTGIGSKNSMGFGMLKQYEN